MCRCHMNSKEKKISSGEFTGKKSNVRREFLDLLRAMSPVNWAKEGSTEMCKYGSSQSLDYN